MITWTESSGWFESKEPVFFPVLQQEISINVFTEHDLAEEPGVLTEAHLAAIEGLLAAPPERRSEWPPTVFADFREAVDSGECELDSDDIPERCRTPEDVWALIDWREVVVTEQGPNGDRFILVHGCPGWRIEHGVQLLLKNEHLLWVGRADEAIFMTGDWSKDYLPLRKNGQLRSGHRHFRE